MSLKKRKNIAPPPISRWILNHLSHFEKQFSVTGDFSEIFHEIYLDKGPFKSKMWYRMQVFKSVPALSANYIYWSFVMFKNYLKITLRNIRKHKTFSFINTFGLSIGMACCILMLLYTKNELSFDKFHKNLDNIYLVTPVMIDRDIVSEQSPWLLMPILKNDYPEIAKGTRYLRRNLLTKYADNMDYEQGALVDAEFFEIFTFPFIEGDPHSVFDNLTSTVITEQLAEKYFGEENPIGKPLNFANRFDLTVTGVIKNIPKNSHLQFSFLAPVQLLGDGRINTWSWESDSYIMLHENADPKSVDEKISDAIMKYDKRTNTKTDVNLEPFQRRHNYSLKGTDPIVYIYGFAAMSIMILLIACINFMNLSTAKSTLRAQEIGIRKVTGATRSELIKQFMGESVLVSFASLFVSIIGIYLFLPTFNNLAQVQLSLNLTGDKTLLAGLLLITVTAGLISGSYPAFYLSSFKPANVLKTGFGKTSKASIFRKILVTAQFTSAIILIISTITIYRQLNYINTRDLGFDKENVVCLTLNSELRAQYFTLKEELLRNESIQNVTAATTRPMFVSNINPVYWEGRGPDQYITMNFVTVDYDYFETFDMEFVQGRSFSTAFATDPQNYILNESALKLTGLDNPLGKMFSIWENEGKIIGIVNDFHSRSLHNEIKPLVFTMNRDWGPRYVFIKISNENITGTIDLIRDIVTRLAPSFPFSYSFLDDYFKSQYLNEERMGSIFKYITILAILLSCLGLFGLISFLAVKKAPEIAVRKVLGAATSQVMVLLSREFIILIGIANIVAWPVSYYIAKTILQSFAFRTSTGFVFFILAGVSALLLALITVSCQTFKAATANPVNSLRDE